MIITLDSIDNIIGGEGGGTYYVMSMRIFALIMKNIFI